MIQLSVTHNIAKKCQTSAFTCLAAEEQLTNKRKPTL